MDISGKSGEVKCVFLPHLNIRFVLFNAAVTIPTIRVHSQGNAGTSQRFGSQPGTKGKRFSVSGQRRVHFTGLRASTELLRFV
jgi:hypothetical protein